ncbi:hypothetical protein ACFYO1_42260 [Nocardia sp. NPDC006044]|uniref:hypothetical protein n=1 Tax=Nocardia sp. NPDC006044 TaxID=3364306 RepID=UPI0036CB43D3
MTQTTSTNGIETFTPRTDEAVLDDLCRRLHATRWPDAPEDPSGSLIPPSAWVIDKMRAWSDGDGDIETVYTKDEILTNVMIYWLTGTIGSSMRMYSANAAIDPARVDRRVEAPRATRSSPATCCARPRRGSNAPATWSTSANPTAAATSPPSNNPTATPTTCASSSAPLRS